MKTLLVMILAWAVLAHSHAPVHRHPSCYPIGGGQVQCQTNCYVDYWGNQHCTTY